MNELTKRDKIAFHAGLVGISLNLLLFTLKLFAGLTARSAAILADSLNNLSDAGSSVVSLVGSRMAGKAPDEDHPFGHGRVEYIAAFVVSILIISMGLNALESGIRKIFVPEAISQSLLSLLILFFSILVKLGMGFYYRYVDRRIDSAIYRAASQDAFSDILITSSALLSLLILRFLNINIDAYVGTAVSLFVIFNGIKIAKDTLTLLIGESTDPELFFRITNFVESFPGILGTHDLIVHNYGPGRYMASIHAEVNEKSTVSAAHYIVDRIEKECRKQLGVILVIHMDPVSTDPEVKGLRNRISGIVKSLSPKSSIHDVRIVKKPEKTDISFDLVTAWELDQAGAVKLEEKLSEELHLALAGVYPGLQIHMQLDRPFMHVHSEEEELEARKKAETLPSSIEDRKEDKETGAKEPSAP